MPSNDAVWQTYQFFWDRLGHFTDQVSSAVAALLTEAVTTPGSEEEVWQTYQD